MFIVRIYETHKYTMQKMLSFVILQKVVNIASTGILKGLTFCNFIHYMLSAYISGVVTSLESDVWRKHMLRPLTLPHQSEMLFWYACSILYLYSLDYVFECTKGDIILKMTLKVKLTIVRVLGRSPSDIWRWSVLMCGFLCVILTACGKFLSFPIYRNHMSLKATRNCSWYFNLFKTSGSLFTINFRIMKLLFSPTEPI